MYVRADTLGDQLTKLRDKIDRLMALPRKNSRVNRRIDQYFQDVKNLQHLMGVKELTMLEQLREDIKAFYLLDDLRGWDK